MRFPGGVVAQQGDRLAGQVEAVGRQPLDEDLGRPAHRVRVGLVVEIELAVGVAERAGVDRAAELALADQRLGRLRHERPARIGAARDAGALAVAAPLAGGEIEQIMVADADHFRRPGPARLGPGRQRRHRVVQPIAVAQRRPVDQIGRHRHLDVGLAPLGIGGIGEKLPAMRQDEGIGEVGRDRPARRAADRRALQRAWWRRRRPARKGSRLRTRYSQAGGCARRVGFLPCRMFSMARLLSDKSAE